MDAGCGDWSFSSTIDWGDASYLGVDIASDVIDAVRKKHEKGKITFRVGDITEELPAADLLISKDVLQHLSNALVQKFIRNNLRGVSTSGSFSRMTVAAETGTPSPEDTGRSTSPPLRSK